MNERREFERVNERLDTIIWNVAVIEEQLAVLSRYIIPPSAATAVLSITSNQGANMPIELGDTAAVATLTFTDAEGNAVAPPTGDGSGLVVTFSVDDESVATVGTATASGDTATAPLTPVAAGSFNLSVEVANTSGAALVDNDGSTPFVQASSLADTVIPAPVPQATTGVISING